MRLSINCYFYLHIADTHLPLTLTTLLYLSPLDDRRRATSEQDENQTENDAKIESLDVLL